MSHSCTLPTASLLGRGLARWPPIGLMVTPLLISFMEYIIPDVKMAVPEPIAMAGRIAGPHDWRASLGRAGGMPITIPVRI